MVKVRSFHGYVCDKKFASQIMASPYDTISKDDAIHVGQNNEKSFLHVNRPEIDLPPQISPFDQQVYEQGRANLVKFIKNGLLVQEAQSIMYIYSQQYKAHIQYGIILEVSIQDYTDNLIKKQEMTKTANVANITKMMNSQGAFTGPVFLAYQDNDKINSIVANAIKREAYVLDQKQLFFDDKGRLIEETLHSLWKCTVEESEQLEGLFGGQVNSMYIADGHHRMASAENVKRMRNEKGGVLEFVLAIAYPQSQLRILRQNLLIKDAHGKSPKIIQEELKLNFDITALEPGNQADEPQEKGIFALYLNKQWFYLNFRHKLNENSNNNPLSKLDVQVLFEYVLKPILGIDNLSSSDNIVYEGGIYGLDEVQFLCDKNGWVCAFSPSPITFEELVKVVDSGHVMPPKSTWFDPKPCSGLVVSVFDKIC